jgi:hypothetical protein
LAGGGFADLGPAGRAEIATTFRETGGAPLAALVRVVLLCYYRDDRVMQSLGLEPRPPFPKGHLVERATGRCSIPSANGRRCTVWSNKRLPACSGGGNPQGEFLGTNRSELRSRISPDNTVIPENRPGMVAGARMRHKRAIRIRHLHRLGARAFLCSELREDRAAHDAPDRQCGA